MKQISKYLILFTATVFAAALATPASAAMRFVTIGTGGVTGVYYPAGGAISKMVNQKSKVYNLRVTVESTAGSVFNVNSVMAGDLEFGVVQSDRQYQAYNGTADWKGRPQKNLRSVFSLHPEVVNLVAAVDSGINTLNDIKGKRISIGNPGSGERGNALDLLKAAGINWETDFHAEGLKAAEAAGMLQDGRIDAYFYTVGHPNGSFKEATSGTRKVRFVPIPQNLIDKLCKEHPYYAPAMIPVEYYPGADNKADVPTFGVKATFVTNANVSADIVYDITKEVFDNLDQFKTLHPAFKVLTKQNMLQGLTAPIHPGALKYYKEVGLIK
jgi:TRAP transporter TAXI family solute receptor